MNAGTLHKQIGGVKRRRGAKFARARKVTQRSRAVTDGLHAVTQTLCRAHRQRAELLK